jgi:hypothetical protein
MMRNPVSRREFLLGSASLMLAAGPAAALSLEDDPARERLYLAACETRSRHDEIVDQLVAQIEAEQTVTPEAHAATIEKVKALRCPTCGCALGSVEPYTGKF